MAKYAVAATYFYVDESGLILDRLVGVNLEANSKEEAIGIAYDRILNVDEGFDANIIAWETDLPVANVDAEEDDEPVARNSTAGILKAAREAYDEKNAT